MDFTGQQEKNMTLPGLDHGVDVKGKVASAALNGDLTLIGLSQRVDAHSNQIAPGRACDRSTLTVVWKHHAGDDSTVLA